MSAKPASNTSAVTWIASLVAAVVLYGLSFGPVYALTGKGVIPAEYWPVLSKVYWPIGWLCQYQPVADAASSYYVWWDKLLK